MTDASPEAKVKDEAPPKSKREDKKTDEDKKDKDGEKEQVEAAKADDDEEADQPPKKSSKKSTPLDWLLSDEAFDLANPEIPEGHGEIDYEEGQQRKTPPESDIDTKPSNADKEAVLRYPRSRLTPFQNLVAASILSKPLSHKLGLRTIQTLLNPPFSLRTLHDLDEAGYEGRRKVMWEARTQHKERTASLLGDLCDGIKDLCGEDEEDLSELAGVHEKIKGVKAPEEAQKTIVDTLTKIKGIGPGVASIFLRRVQRDWEEVFPYIDDRSLKAAKAFGLVSEEGGAAELKDKVGGDREKYVRLVDVLVGLELEKKVDEAMKAAGV